MAHRINVTGTITKQVIEAIYTADLVIANLTGRNPNVMYELALRHCLGTPLITIADKEISLPADIISERTIFYYNDAKGVLELRQLLVAYLEKIDYEQKSSPILDALSDIAKTNSLLELTQENNTDENNALNFIIRKLDRIESRIERNSSSASFPRRATMRFRFESAPENFNIEDMKQMLQAGLSPEMLHITDISIRGTGKSIIILYIIDGPIDVPGVYMRMIDILSEAGFIGVSLMTGMRIRSIE